MAVAIDAAENTAAWFTRVTPLAIVSWSFWARLTAAAGNPSLLNLFDGATQRANMYIERSASPDEVMLAINRPSAGFRFLRLASSDVPADGAWHHWAGWYNATLHTGALYIDGALQAGAVVSSGGTAPSADSAQMDDTGATNWTTEIADFALWFGASSPIDAQSAARLAAGRSARDGVPVGGALPLVHQAFLRAPTEWGAAGAVGGAPTWTAHPPMTF